MKNIESKNNKLNKLSYYLVHSFIIFNIYNYIRFGMADVYPQLQTSIIYGVNSDFTERITNGQYCDTPSSCITEMCQIYNSDFRVGHIVIDFLSPEINIDSCYPSYLETIINSEIILQCVIVFIIYLTLILSRSLLYKFCSCESLVFIIFFLEKIILFSILFLLPYIDILSYGLFIVMSIGFSIIELFLLFEETGNTL
ncbi:Transmembrane domain-containing protein [Orpheovirus IHUMI-LCC2]|uniref:Transmembrane domain-containing protein n=1 Tax=Orpheovirus IHUMI-LCC2 TaxID=2023057 RepID=A0A2I2L4C2_9VIRU|nr:Transmembrane domain-containing protein [Orpheovirus IHUMI-LCC2]SNW62374.1 Transmembrane domain-containing protein [Orpheovirus IHUMI-LCC2]